MSNNDSTDAIISQFQKQGILYQPKPELEMELS
jgi:hypothetical protein